MSWRNESNPLGWLRYRAECACRLYRTIDGSMPNSPRGGIDIGFAPSVAALSFIFSAQAYYLHSPTTLHFGPLGKVLVDKRFHRIHHSIEPRHHHSNFGAMTTLWDRLFGTAYFPAKGEWPTIGLADTPEPKTLGEWSSIPFGRRVDPSMGNGGVRVSPRSGQNAIQAPCYGRPAPKSLP